MSALVSNLLVFGRLLRSRGLEVHVGRLLDVVEALQHVNLGLRDDVFHTCRTLLVHRHEDLAAFDRAFDAFWRGHGAMFEPRGGGADDRDAPGSPPPEPGTGAHEARSAGDIGIADDTVAGMIQTWSDAEVFARKDFAAFSAKETARARAALDRLEWTSGRRRTRRWVPGGGPRIDLRRALAQSVRTGGDVVRLPRRRRRTRPRPVVVLCDVSGSMERYSRVLLHFAHTLAARDRRVDAFVFSTRLTRITRQLRARRVDTALASVSSVVPDWSGGTRIGDALRQFHQRWGRRMPRGGSVVLLVSDGWDRGDPAILCDQIKRLRRRCHRLIWLNPLIGTANYEPLTRGLQAALPFVDDFWPARTLTNLADLALHLNALAARGSR